MIEKTIFVCKVIPVCFVEWLAVIFKILLIYRLTAKKSRGGKEFYDKVAALKLIRQAKVIFLT